MSIKTKESGLMRANKQIKASTITGAVFDLPPSEEWNFNQDLNVNPRKDMWLYTDPNNVQNVVLTRFPATML